LNLKCDILVSNFAFKCNLYRYNTAAQGGMHRAAGGAAAQVESS
jgi:hypothetical protein